MRRITLLVLALVIVSLAVSAGTKRHPIRLFTPSDVNGTELKPGEYNVALEDGNAVFYRGSKAVAKSPAHSEENASKFANNSIVYNADERVVMEVRIGGSNTKLVLDGTAVAKGSSRPTSGTK